MYCRKCGKEVEGDREFCESCAPQTPPANMKICQYCGKETSNLERFCQHCGGYFKDSTAPQKKWQPSAPKSSTPNSNMKSCRNCGSLVPKTNVYCSRCGKMADTVSYTYVNPGSFASGFLLIFFLGLIGLIIVGALNQSETWRGAKCCLKVWLIIVLITVVLVGVAYCALSQTGGGYYGYY